MKSIRDYLKKTGYTFSLIMITALILSGCGDDDSAPAERNPEISSINPESGPPGTAVTITGSDFSPTASENQVTFAGTEAEVTGASESELNTTVPEDAESGPVEVTVDGNTASGPNFTIQTDAPGITEVNPDSGAVGDTITIVGTNFSPNPEEVTITFNGTNATVNSAAEDELETEVPEGATDGPIEVTINDQTTTYDSFNVLDDSGDDGDNGDDGNGNSDGNSISQAISGDDELSELASLLGNTTDLESTLEGEGPYTILAPTDDALSNLPADLSDEEIEEILSYHVLEEDRNSNSFNPQENYETLEGESIYVAGNGSINNTANIQEGDIDADNGNIHKIDNILYPDTYSNVFAITYKRYETNKFACTCVSGRTGLQGVLEDESTDFTLFVPTDAAFNAREVPVDSLEDNELQDLMDYHIIDNQALTSNDLSDGQTLTTRNGAELTVSIAGDGTITLDNGAATVETVDLEGTNGVVHIIDTVMDPSDN